MNFTKSEKAAIRREFTAVASSLVGRPINVVECTPEEDELGYTSDKGDIHISLTYEDFYNGLTKSQAYIGAKGVFCHEMLHQLITRFPEYSASIAAKPAYEQPVYANILNICEDSAIEYFAPSYVSEEYVHALEFMRANIYRTQPLLDTTETPFTQFMTAVLHFRFFGFLKGKFTFPEAQETFKKCIADLSAVIEEPIQKKRIEHAESILKLSRPLWEEDAKNREEMQKMLNDMMKKFFSSTNNGSGNGSDESSPSEKGDDSLSRRRKITFRKVSPEEYKKAMEKAEKGSSPDMGGDIEVLIPDGPVEKDEPDKKSGSGASIPVPSPADKSEKKSKDENGGGSAGGEKSEEDDSPKGDGGSKGSEKGENSDEDGLGKEPSENESDDKGCDNSSAPGTPDRSMSPDGANPFDGSREVETPEVTASADDYTGSLEALESEMTKELTLTSEELLALRELHEEYLRSEAVEAKECEEADVKNFDLPVSGGYKDVCKKAKCQNVLVNCPKDAASMMMYNRIVANMSTGISSLSSQLSRILKNRQEEKIYKQSGKVSLKRLNCGRVTSRVFTKRRLPDAADLAVAIAIDMSGSMHGNKIAVAQQAAIALTEVFGKLKVPLYVFGFSADESRFDVNHFHFINWSNRKSDRLRLLAVQARSNNFDGYSIRYAAEVLRRKDADKKLLIVISDGMPAASVYQYVPGAQDVKLAINEANRVATTIGVLLGGHNPEKHREMYGYNFIHCDNVNELFPKLGSILKKYM